MIALPEIRPLDPAAVARFRQRIADLAKPPGSLGKIEDLAARIGALRDGRVLDRGLVAIFAGDHGLTEEGVSRYPASVTAVMVANFLAGRATANAFARAVDADVMVVDAGVAADLPADPALHAAKIRKGTRNAAREPALTAAEVDAALAAGVALGGKAAADGYDMIAIGEMGIGNSASAALLMHALTGLPIADCVGLGAGHDDAGLAHKRAVLERAAARAKPTDAHAALCEFGGCEIAMMAGAVLGAAAAGVIVIVDGFISSAAALAAIRLVPAVRDGCVFSHCSAEAGHARMLDALVVSPLLTLDMRLGEGTGALLAMPILRAASRLLTDVATLAEVLAGAAS